MFFEFAVFSQQQKPWSQSLIVHKSDLVGGIPTPLKNMSSSNGIIIPNIWKNKIHVPNHQQGISIICYLLII
jgi:hypothetical protein